jgi:hypothetical protein
MPSGSKVGITSPPGHEHSARWFRYGGCVLEKISAEVPPLPSGKWLIGFSIPLLAGWISAATTSRTDLFIGPFFWVFIYVLVVGIGTTVWGAVSMPISPPGEAPDEAPGPTTYSISQFKRRVGLGSGWAVVLEELALGVASFFLFSAFVG